MKRRENKVFDNIMSLNKTLGKRCEQHYKYTAQLETRMKLMCRASKESSLWGRRQELISVGEGAP